MAGDFRFSTADDALQQFHALLDEEREPEANRLLAAALDAYPDDPQLLLWQGVGFLAPAPDAARGSIQRALQQSQGDEFIVVSCAELLFRLGDIDAVRDALAGINESALMSDVRLVSRVIALSGQLAWDGGDLDAAEVAFRRAYKLAPDFIGHGECLARVLADQGRLTEATSVARDALTHLPDDPALERAITEIDAGREDGD